MERQVHINDPKTNKEMKEYKYKIGGEEYVVEIAGVENGIATVAVNGEQYIVEMEAEPERKKPEPAAEQAEAPAKEKTAANTSAAVKAPLPGVITEIKVAVGDKVKTGDTLLLLEAMKMANNIDAECDGTVTAILVKTGESVMEDTPLVVVE